jgi:hypothetical protein
MAAALVLATIAFAASRFGPTREPLYFIGTPIESRLNGGSSLNDPLSTSSRSIEQDAKAEGLVVGICGAPTRSGKPCQRKVKGGGYCWQHREKSIEKGSNRRE